MQAQLKPVPQESIEPLRALSFIRALTFSKSLIDFRRQAGTKFFLALLLGMLNVLKFRPS